MSVRPVLFLPSKTARRRACGTMIHKVPLSEYPTDLQLPDELRQQFWYDADAQHLCFDGFMGRGGYDRLKKLSRDWQYQLAIDELYRICIPDDATDRSSTAKAVIMAAAVLAVITVCALAVWLLLAA